METNLISWGLNALMGVAMYLLKNAHNDIKEQVKENRDAIARVKEEYFKKEDFREFKDELWGRLDRFEDSVKAQIRDS